MEWRLIHHWAFKWWSSEPFLGLNTHRDSLPLSLWEGLLSRILNWLKPWIIGRMWDQEWIWHIWIIFNRLGPRSWGSWNGISTEHRMRRFLLLFCWPLTFWIYQRSRIFPCIFLQPFPIMLLQCLTPPVWFKQTILNSLPRFLPLPLWILRCPYLLWVWVIIKILMLQRLLIHIGGWDLCKSWRLMRTWGLSQCMQLSCWFCLELL